MCGIVGAIGQRNITRILIEGLRRLEYRGYDSASVAVLDAGGQLDCRKHPGKVAVLEEDLAARRLAGNIGIAHTRWATHGVPSEVNAHPHLSGPVALVHNGIIENYETLREELLDQGYEFISQTDSEVIAHLLASYCEHHDLLTALAQTVKRLEGAYAIAAISTKEPNRLVGARKGSPLVLGYGIDEMYLASDTLALRQVTDSFSYLEEGDLVDVTRDGATVYDSDGNELQRERVRLGDRDQAASKGRYRHFMEKEIFEQPQVIEATLQGRLSDRHVLEASFGLEARRIFSETEGVHIVACGTSFHAGLVARHWLEEWANIPCRVEIASEYRYRNVYVHPNSLFVTISQSGETADTLAALRKSKELGYLASLAICNVPNSSLVRESDFAFMTHAGPEIGVASTKAFTTQLVALQILAIALGRHHQISEEQEVQLVQALHRLPELVERVLKEKDAEIEQTFEVFTDKSNVLFLGRGVHWPTAMEGALKLKEISYIHAEAYAAGELKHGPLALVDDKIPVIAVAPTDDLLDKLKSNLQEVRARGGMLYVFADEDAGFHDEDGITVIQMPKVPDSLAPMIYTIPLQLLAYHVALMKGTDVDQPRNLAKSVTVE